MSSHNTAPRLSVLLGLALRDLAHDRKVSICMMASVVAVVAPLLLLFGLKFGIVSQMRHELLSDPRNKEVKMIASDNLDQAWFDRMRALPSVGFVMPLTRALNTVADLYVDSTRFVENVELIPTAAGDPLLGDVLPPTSANHVILTTMAAQRLGVKPGDTVRLNISRQLNKVNERAQMQVQVQAVLPSAAFGRAAAFVTLPLLVSLEDFRDGFQASLLNVTKGASPRPRQHFARARIYATDIEQVESLASSLTQQRIETSSRLSEIKSVQQIDRVLSIVFNVIAWAAVLGCAASMVGGLMANIDRKRKDLALLRLFGYGREAMLGYVMMQAMTLTTLGFGLGYMLYGLGSILFDRLLGVALSAGRFVCRLEPTHVMFALCAALLVSLCVSLFGGILVTKIEPAESLRDV
jgi:putative ABC transport system permease protein